VDCARLPETLAESELYGHERGAFTGAVDRRIGHFERANGGTVFLDEVGELSPDLQKKLLRFLDENVFERIGGTELLRTDVRVLAATHRPLRELVAAGQFREDLYYRLNVVTVHIPDLRERQEDIELLATHFLRQATPAKALSREALEALRAYRWPGNVRELRNSVQHAAVMSKGNLVTVEDLPPSVREAEPGVEDDFEAAVRRLVDEELKGEPPDDLHASSVARLERLVIRQVLDFTGGNQFRAARILGLHRTTLRKKIAEYGLL
jgi:DNA-binding NtrC family response regulator